MISDTMTLKYNEGVQHDTEIRQQHLSNRPALDFWDVCSQNAACTSWGLAFEPRGKYAIFNNDDNPTI